MKIDVSIMAKEELADKLIKADFDSVELTREHARMLGIWLKYGIQAREAIHQIRITCADSEKSIF